MPTGSSHYCALMTALVALLLPWSARAGDELQLEVNGSADPTTGAMTEVRPGLGGAQVDFGLVASLGPQPRTGRRVDGASGEARYVATLEVIVHRTADNGLTVQSYRPGLNPDPAMTDLPTVDPGGVHPSVSIPGVQVGGSTDSRRVVPLVRSPAGSMTRPLAEQARSRGGYYVPPAGNGDTGMGVQTVDLYVRLAGAQGGDTSVWFAPADVPLTPDNPGLEVSWFDTLAATAVPIGQPFRCQLSLSVPPSEWGHQSAHIAFSARPSVL